MGSYHVAGIYFIRNTFLSLLAALPCWWRYLHFTDEMRLGPLTTEVGPPLQSQKVSKLEFQSLAPAHAPLLSFLSHWVVLTSRRVLTSRHPLAKEREKDVASSPSPGGKHETGLYVRIQGHVFLTHNPCRPLFPRQLHRKALVKIQI